MNENEIWKNIDFYEGLYQVSNLGRVKSLGNEKTKKEKILKFGKNRYGYLYVNLCKNGKTKTCTVHRLVATAFIENQNNLPQVNHKDENKENNCVDNLEWCDAKYNANYGSRIAKVVANTDYKACQSKRVANTDWKTKVANTDYKAIAAKIDYKAIAEKLTNRQDQSKHVYQYNTQGELIKIWQSTHECGRNGFNQGNISKCCNGKLKSHKGFIWSYEEIKK